MILIYAIISLSILAILIRRDFSTIGQMPFRGGWKLGLFVLGLFLLQAVFVIYVSGQNIIQMLLVISSQIVLALLFLLNRHIPGAKLFALGIILNTVVMLANGGWMPITPETYHSIRPERNVELQARAPASKGIMLEQHETNLWFLTDIIPVNYFGHKNALSIGDVLILVGIAQFFFLATPSKDKNEPASRASQVNTSP
ncbi:MAG: DUF5317 domain-containing protein [Anaerolineae bacterium]|nr:DUF5317 domain-containing protein [Anaerolineae bacterium]